MLRHLLNLLIYTLVIWLGSLLFPNFIYAENFGYAFLASFLIWVVACVIALIFGLIALVGSIGDNCLWVVIGFIGMFLSVVIAILLLSHWMPSFEVSGFWTAVLIAIVFSVLELRKPKENRD